MNCKKYVHFQKLLHILCIIMSHIHTTHSFGNFLSTFHRSGSMEDDYLATTTEFISITNNNNIKATQLQTPKQTTNNTKPTQITNICNTNQSPLQHSNNNRTTSNTTTYIPYSVQTSTITTSPILSFINHTSTYKQVFNPSFIPQSDTVPHAGLMIQVQNCSLKPGICTYCNATPGLVFTPCDILTGQCNKVLVPSGNIPLLTYNTSIPNIIFKRANYYQNPSIFYWNNLYYLFVASLKNVPQIYVELYTTNTPRNMTSWQLKKSAFPTNNKISIPTSLLPRNVSHSNTKHYLFFGGEGHISVTNSCLLTQWENIDYAAWLSPRGEAYFDRDGVETGPSPIKLHDGNYLMLYNGYKTYDVDIEINNHEQVVPHGAKHYAIGWLILDGANPSKILQRSETPLITATYDYQIGNAPFTCTQRSSVYAKAIVRMPKSSTNGTESFRVYFSAADTSVGTAVIVLSHGTDSNSGKWYEIAMIVSIGCGIFVIIMVLMIWCKNNKETLDLTTEAQFLSVASTHTRTRTHISNISKEISGTNHHGTPYVIGSLDRKYNKLSTKSNENINPNHIHVHTTECYEESKGNCSCLVINDGNALNNASLTSNTSTNSSGTSCSADGNDSPISSTSSYCMECDGKHNENENEQSNKSDTMRLSQISFKINETLEKESPSNKYSTITIAGYNPNDTKFSFFKKNQNNFGEPFVK